MATQQDSKPLTDAQKLALGKNFVEPQQKEEETPLTEQEKASVAKVNAEVAALMTMKAALIETTASRGWFYIEKFAETIVRELEKEAIAEEDDAKANGLRRDARGARKFKEKLLHRIELAKRQEPGNFLEVSTD